MVLNKLLINTKLPWGGGVGVKRKNGKIFNLCCSFTKIFVTGYFIIPSRDFSLYLLFHYSSKNRTINIFKTGSGITVINGK